MQYCNIDQLIGKQITTIEITEEKDHMFFRTYDNETYVMYHIQDCCEGVYIEDIIGDLKDLIMYKIQYAKEDSHSPEESECESCTYTFYKLGTAKGYVDIRWFGESNGYYSESVQFAKLEDDSDYIFFKQPKLL